MSIVEFNQVYVSKDTIHRLVKDIKQLRKHPLHDQGIYYVHDDTNMLKGYALIVGASGTPYHGGYYFFEFDFPPNYPHAPPTVTYHTNGQNVRFNPNLYTNGKVCVSLLNTWPGEQWTSCQTITSVLLALCTLLCDNPLMNEPGITSSEEDIHDYNTVIAYSNLNIAVCDVVLKTEGIHQPFFDLFEDVIQEQFRAHYPSWVNFLERKKEEQGTHAMPVAKVIDFFEFGVMLDYGSLQYKLALANKQCTQGDK